MSARKVTAEEAMALGTEVIDRQIRHMDEHLPYVAPELLPGEIAALIRNASRQTAQRIVETYDVRLKS